MRRVLVVPATDKNQTLFPLPEEEVHHLTQVLRIRQGEKIECLDGKGHFFTGELNLLGKGKGQILRQSDVLTDPNRMAIPLTLQMACLKGDAMDWLVEKCVEIGVKTFSPLMTDHTVVQMGRKSPDEFQKRWQKIADQSLKQCGRLERMEIQAPLTLEECFQRDATSVRIWAAESEKTLPLEKVLSDWKPADPYTLLIGPEGGWSQKEILFLKRVSTISVSLGPWIYRAETAAMVATSLCVSNVRKSNQGNL